jgi:hypothetical protein
MNWINCSEKLPAMGIEIYCKYKNMRPIQLLSDDLILEYEDRNSNDSDNYWWRLSNANNLD